MATLGPYLLGFSVLDFECGLWILIVWGIPDSLNCISDSKAQYQKIPRKKFPRIPDFTSKHFLDSGIRIPLYMGEVSYQSGAEKVKEWDSPQAKR